MTTFLQNLSYIYIIEKVEVLRKYLLLIMIYKLSNTLCPSQVFRLYTSDQAYWRFVREFLPKTEQMILKAEWGDVNDRRLSIAWLKDAFNKGTLGFQMMAFRGPRFGPFYFFLYRNFSSKKVLTRFYHQNACMMNGGMLEAVCDLMDKLVTVQFAFYVCSS